MKIAVVGGGSTYAPELLHGLAEGAEPLALDAVTLYDIDEARLAVVGDFCRRMVARRTGRTKVSTTGNLEEAVEGADFVVVQIRVGGQAARLEDERLGLDHGVIGQETTGVGGFSKALRTVPVLLDIAHRTQRVAPNATLINFTNPVSIVTEALLQHAELMTIGLCNIPLSQRMEVAAHLGVEPHRVEIDSVGLNHLSFVRGVRVNGEERLEALLEDVTKLLDSGHKPANLPDLDFPPELLRSLRMIPSDYLRYYYLHPDTVAEQRGAEQLRAQQVMAIEEELLAYYADPKNDERPELLAQRGGAFYSHAALEIIRAITLDEPARLIVDTRNGDTVRELPPDACVEVPCNVRANGATPLPQAPLPPEIRGLIQHVKAYEELTVRAALSGAWRDVYLAALNHPLTPSAQVAESVADRVSPRGRP